MSTNDKIKIGASEDGPLSLDVNKLIDSRALIQGNSGGGKSWLLRLICEQAPAFVPVIVLDPEGEFASLREKVDAILIGPEGDVPTDLRSAALLARKLVELQISAIIDLYELKPHERREYVRLFLDALVELPRELWHPTLVVIDEAHKFCPEKGTGESVSTQSVINLMSLGRKRGYAGILATQRFSKLHNDAIAETNNVFIGRTWLDADQKRAGEYLGLNAADRRTLRDLKQGEFYAFGPACSQGGMVKFKSDKVTTTHPKAGQRHKVKPPKASEAITHIVSQIEDLPEVVEQEKKDIASIKAAAADTESKLRQEIFSLTNELKRKETPAVVTETRSVYPEEKLVELQDLIDEYFKPFSQMLDNAQTTAERIEELVAALLPDMPLSRPEGPPRTLGVPAKFVDEDLPPKGAYFKYEGDISAPLRQGAGNDARVPNTLQSGPEYLANVNRAPASDLGAGRTLSGPEQKILDTLRSFEALGLSSMKRPNLAALVGYAASTKSYVNALSSLRTAGLIDYDTGSVRLSEAGRVHAAPVSTPPSRQALIDAWMKMLSGPAQTMLRFLLSRHPDKVERWELASVCNYAESTKSFVNGLSRMRSLGLIDYGPNKTVFVTELLFPEGLR